MMKNMSRALKLAGVVGILATSTHVVRAAERGDGDDSRRGAVRMTFSGSMIPTAIEVKKDTITDEELLQGDSSFGPFTFRKLRTDSAHSEPASCGAGFGASVPVVAGGGVVRFEDGSLLMVTIAEGVLCVDFQHLVGHLTETYQITGGTGRFNGASGTLQLTATLKPVLFSDSNAAVLLTTVGELKGAVRVP